MANLLRNPGVVPALWLALVVAGAGPTLAGGTVGNSLLSKDLCATLIAQAERRHGIPARLLRAISLAETGRVDPHSKAMIAWPWAVNAGGKGRFYPTKAMAMAAVRQLRAKGARNIDVGCMQVNLMHHPKAFSSIEAAFEPARNVAYAASFLRRLQVASGSWIQAIANYHSQDDDRGRRYMLRVLQIWVNQAPGKASIRMAQRGAPGALQSPAHERFMRSNTLFGRSHRQGRHVVRVVRGTPAGLLNSPSLFNRTRVVRGFEAKRKWAEIIQRRRNFAEWLAKRQAERRAGHDPS